MSTSARRIYENYQRQLKEKKLYQENLKQNHEIFYKTIESTSIITSSLETIEKWIPKNDLFHLVQKFSYSSKKVLDNDEQRPIFPNPFQVQLISMIEVKLLRDEIQFFSKKNILIKFSSKCHQFYEKLINQIDIYYSSLVIQESNLPETFLFDKWFENDLSCLSTFCCSICCSHYVSYLFYPFIDEKHEDCNESSLSNCDCKVMQDLNNSSKTNSNNIRFAYKCNYMICTNNSCRGLICNTCVNICLQKRNILKCMSCQSENTVYIPQPLKTRLWTTVLFDILLKTKEEKLDLFENIDHFYQDFLFRNTLLDDQIVPQIHLHSNLTFEEQNGYLLKPVINQPKKQIEINENRYIIQPEENQNQNENETDIEQEQESDYEIESDSEQELEQESEQELDDIETEVYDSSENESESHYSRIRRKRRKCTFIAYQKIRNQLTMLENTSLLVNEDEDEDEEKEKKHILSFNGNQTYSCNEIITLQLLIQQRSVIFEQLLFLLCYFICKYQTNLKMKELCINSLVKGTLSLDQLIIQFLVLEKNEDLQNLDIKKDFTSVAIKEPLFCSSNDKKNYIKNLIYNFDSLKDYYDSNSIMKKNRDIKFFVISNLSLLFSLYWKNCVLYSSSLLTKKRKRHSSVSESHVPENSSFHFLSDLNYALFLNLTYFNQ